VSKVNTIDLLREHILRYGFRPQYHVWVFHGEEGVYEEQFSADDVHKDGNMAHTVEEVESEYDHEDDDYAGKDIDGIDEMMEGIGDDLGKTSRLFDYLTEASQKPLYPGCTKLTKLPTVLTLFNIKSKYNWSDTSFTTMLEAHCHPETSHLMLLARL